MFGLQALVHYSSPPLTPPPAPTSPPPPPLPLLLLPPPFYSSHTLAQSNHGSLSTSLTCPPEPQMQLSASFDVTVGGPPSPSSSLVRPGWTPSFLLWPKPTTAGCVSPGRPFFSVVPHTNIQSLSPTAWENKTPEVNVDSILWMSLLFIIIIMLLYLTVLFDTGCQNQVNALLNRHLEWLYKRVAEHGCDGGMIHLTLTIRSFKNPDLVIHKYE